MKKPPKIKIKTSSQHNIYIHVIKRNKLAWGTENYIFIGEILKLSSNSTLATFINIE